MKYERLNVIWRLKETKLAIHCRKIPFWCFPHLVLDYMLSCKWGEVRYLNIIFVINNIITEFIFITWLKNVWLTTLMKQSMNEWNSSERVMVMGLPAVLGAGDGVNQVWHGWGGGGHCHCNNQFRVQNEDLFLGNFWYVVEMLLRENEKGTVSETMKPIWSRSSLRH